MSTPIQDELRVAIQVEQAIRDNPPHVESGPAFFNADERYRWGLLRSWADQGAYLLFVGLNPSTADATKNDPTMRRVIGFAQREGFRGVWMGNLFAYRATDPRELRHALDPVGSENNRWLQRMASWSRYVCFGWGTHGAIHGRGTTVAELLAAYDPFCLGTTKAGYPRHPLYLRGDTKMVKYQPTGVAT